MRHVYVQTLLWGVVIAIFSISGPVWSQTVITSTYGFDPADSTRFLQAAINSGADTVIVPNIGQPWIITPLLLASNQEIIFEPGVEVLAKVGEFTGPADSLFSAIDKSNITITAYGATFRMHQADYASGGIYPVGEWRTGFALDGVSNFTFQGGTIKDTGGDGICFGNWGKGYNDNLVIKDVLFDNVYRNGISIVSAEDVLIESCTFQNINDDDGYATGPSSGIDLEPNGANHRLVNIVIQDCLADNNDGPAFMVVPANLDSTSLDVSILFDNVHVTSGNNFGLMVSGVKDDGPGGSIEFKNSVVEDTYLSGIRVLDKSSLSTSARVRFENITLNNVATGPDDAGGYPGVPNVPLLMHLQSLAYSTQPGGVDYVNIDVTDARDRATIAYKAPWGGAPGLFDIQGDVTVHNGPLTAWADFGVPTTNVNLTIIEGAPEPATIMVMLVGALALAGQRRR